MTSLGRWESTAPSELQHLFLSYEGGKNTISLRLLRVVGAHGWDGCHVLHDGLKLRHVVDPAISWDAIEESGAKF